ncbi:MAG: (d)CMP kinase [Flavobacteriaceae bacterium]
MHKITIAIDGHSSTGKSTVARQLADYIGYLYVDSGAMYRAVTLFALGKQFISETHFDKSSLVKALNDIHLDFKPNAEGKQEMYLNGENVERQIRTLQVSEFVSPIAAVSEVRKKLVEQQQLLGRNGGVVMDGRDIGTVVFPKAELKIFMTASVDVRAQRRYEELLQRGDSISFDAVLENVMERDQIDSTRADSPLRIADDAIVLDTSEMDEEDQFHVILQLTKDRIAKRV